MATIKTEHGITRGTSADGRIVFVYSRDDGGIRIDGRWAKRGFYQHCLPGGMVGGMNQADPVSSDDWTAACALMDAVIAAHDAYSDALREQAFAALDAREAALDGVEKVRGGAYDANTY